MSEELLGRDLDNRWPHSDPSEEATAALPNISEAKSERSQLSIPLPPLSSLARMVSMHRSRETVVWISVLQGWAAVAAVWLGKSLLQETEMPRRKYVSSNSLYTQDDSGWETQKTSQTQTLPSAFPLREHKCPQQTMLPERKLTFLNCNHREKSGKDFLE